MSVDYCEWARVFGPRMQRGLIRAILDRQATRQGLLSADDIAECIATAWAMLEADAEQITDFPPLDLKMVEIAQQAARESRGSTIDEIINALL